MRRVMVRYKVKPERAAENEELVRAVYDELQRTAPDGLRYATFRLEDGVSFVHVSPRPRTARNPLTEVEAFARFQEGIARSLRASGRWSRSCTRSGRIASTATRAGADGAEPASGRPPRAAHRRPRGRQRVLRRPAALAHGADRCRAAPATTRWGWAAPSGAGSSSARRAARCGCPTSRSIASTRSPTARGALGASRPARAARGAGGLAQRRGDARGRRDRLLAAQGAARRLGCGDDRARAARRRAGRRRGRLRPARRAPSRAARRPLLPHARLGRRCRGRRAGRAAARLARARALRGAQLAADVAVHDRHQRLPEGDRAQAQARAPGRLRPGHRPPRGHGATAGRVGLDRALSGSSASASRRRWPVPRRATSSARASSSPSSRRCSTCRRASAPCSSCATCSASRAPRWPTRSRRRPRPSTARCSARTRASTHGCPSAASRPRCGRSGDEAPARDRRRVRRGLGARRRRRGGRDARPGGDHRHAADADLVPRARRGGGLPAPLAAGARDALARGRAPARAASRPSPSTCGAKRHGAFAAHDVVVLALDAAGRIAELIAFLEPEAFRHFDLPASVR